MSPSCFLYCPIGVNAAVYAISYFITRRSGAVKQTSPGDYCIITAIYLNTSTSICFCGALFFFLFSTLLSEAATAARQSEITVNLHPEMEAVAFFLDICLVSIGGIIGAEIAFHHEQTG